MDAPSHARVGRAATAFGADPVDVLAGVFDVARLAVYAILCIDLQPHAFTGLLGHVFVHTCVNKRGGGAVA